MLKKILIVISMLILVGCGKEEIKKRNLQVEGNDLNYQLIEKAEDYLIPLNLVLDNLNIEYQIEEDEIIFGDIKLTLNSSIALVSNNAKNLNNEVKKEDGNILVSLNFLVNNLRLTYLEDEANVNIKIVNGLLTDYKEALNIFEEGTSAVLIDVLTGLEVNIRRVEGGFTTLADDEQVTAADTETLLSIAGGEWNNHRRSVIIKIDEVYMAASLSPFPHSGRDDKPFGEIVDNRSGNTGSGINLNSIRDNNINGVVDVYFFNSIVPGLNRIDERHQEKVLEASYFYR